MAREVDNHLASAAIYPIDVNYTIALKSIDGIHDDYRNKSFKLMQWSPKQNSSDFPTDYVSPTDLLIVKDSYELWALDLESHLQYIVDVVVNKGFLMADNMSEDTIADNVWLIANDKDNGVVGLVNCLRLEPGGDRIRCIFDCNHLFNQIDFNSKPFSQILSNDLAINVLRNGQLGTYRHLTLPKNYDKTLSNEYYLNIGQNRDISSLQWFDKRNMSDKIEGYNLDNKPVKYMKCNIYSSGINFRDVMFATGRITSGPLSLIIDCLIGFEFAGRLKETGERVCGFDMSRCFATSINAMNTMVSKIPDNWSMDDAVTILSTYSTVWYGLIERAILRQNEKVLIHSAAGGVGQAAVNICKYYNCDIFVTVGTEDKKKFLMNEYNIPENRIFSSRDIQFKYKIKSLTDGKGVDIVLNSLTGDKLEASYECVADCGRFVEIGKYDLQMNKQLGMFAFLRDISFIGVSVDQKLFLSEGYIQKWWQWMHENSNNGMIKPINRTVYKAEDVEKAFRYMTTGKHIGKIVIKIRDEEPKDTKVFNPSAFLSSTVKTYFDSNKSYIITGGLGGFGLELAHWMIALGARNLVLTSRYGVTSDYQKFVFKRIESLSDRFKTFGTNITVWTKSTESLENTKLLVKEANSLAPIAGIFHLSVVINDCLYSNHNIDEYIETIDSKTKTFVNLDQITRESAIDLDYFVVFSSVSCGKGNAGQSNYGFANSVCERICESRRRDGLHGLAIQWGPIGDVGVLADTDIVSPLAGIVKQRINSCLDILDKLLQTKHSIVSCIVRAKRQTQSGSRESRIVAQIWQALGIDPKTTPDHLTLGEIGMESMFAVELQQGLERDYDIKVSLNDIKNVTIRMVKEFEAGKTSELKLFTEELRDCRSKLSKIKF
ncbi:unnamed protein product [Medioppia subpectinata]|uniref:Carrier domain-containing protein n=1 Tax=Medioppia subpectinata TaxID=1979941 RepID=A0A7R9PVL2_9ACAR|nr:unnamed protein product [Medioppia subpectinata]CAG2102822.1 unnamed protein product [Medioppia subpectinata]